MNDNTLPSDVEAVYTTDMDICASCCFATTCPKEGYCLCDQYREDNDLNVDGDFYFIKKSPCA